MKVVQCKLKRTTDDGTVEMTAFIDRVFKKQRIEEGMQISLKDDKETVWTISEVFDNSEIEHTDVHRAWHVGGL